MRRWRLLALVLMFSGLANQAAAAGKGVESLRALNGVMVRVFMNTGKDLDEYADSMRVHTWVETSLRRSGVRVHTEEEMLADPHLATLDLELNSIAASVDGSVWAIYPRLSVNQRLFQFGDTAHVVAVDADTWSQGVILGFGTKTLREGGLKTYVTEMAEMFANAWLSVHPPKREP